MRASATVGWCGAEEVTTGRDGLECHRSGNLLNSATYKHCRNTSVHESPPDPHSTSRSLTLSANGFSPVNVLSPQALVRWLAKPAVAS